MKFKSLFFCFLIILSIECGHNDQARDRLWYKTPAKNWNEALPVGNGRLGTMIFSNVQKEQLSLNENTLYSGEPGTTYHIPNIEKDVDKVVNLLRNKKYAKADEYVTKNMLGRIHQCYQPLGDIFIDFGHGKNFSNYDRELDISNAVSTLRYSANGINYKREYFASYPDQVIVMRFSAGEKGKLNFTARYSSVHPTAKQLAAGT